MILFLFILVMVLPTTALAQSVNIRNGNAPGIAAVMNSNPVGTEYGLIVRLLGSVSVTGGLTDAQLRAAPVVVSGTFWQATQPVSGTFWQATQPVSIASMPSTPVTGTFWQATQPVSGTFWQATQPVSGTVTTSPPANASENLNQIAGATPSATNPLPTRDGDGTGFYSSDVIGANRYKKVSAVQDIELSSGNSSTANLAVGASFTGTSQTTLGVGSIQVNVYSDQNLLVEVQQAQEDPGTGWNVKDNWLYFALGTGSEAARTIQATGASTRIVVTNIGTATSTIMNITTAMCPMCDSLPRGLTQLGNLKAAIQEPAPYQKTLPVTIVYSLVPTAPVIPPGANRLQYSAMMQGYCRQTLCPPLPGGLR